MLVQLRQDGANVQMSVSLDLRSLQSRLDCQGTLEEVECSAHLSYASIVAGHVIECHGLSKLVVFAELLTLLEQVLLNCSNVLYVADVLVELRVDGHMLRAYCKALTVLVLVLYIEDEGDARRILAHHFFQEAHGQVDSLDDE